MKLIKIFFFAFFVNFAIAHARDLKCFAPLDKGMHEYVQRRTYRSHGPYVPIFSLGWDIKFRYWFIANSHLGEKHFLKRGDKIFKVNDCSTSDFYRHEYKYQLYAIENHNLPLHLYILFFPDDLYGVIHQIEIERDGKRMTIIPHEPKE